MYHRVRDIELKNIIKYRQCLLLPDNNENAHQNTLVSLSVFGSVIDERRAAMTRGIVNNRTMRGERKKEFVVANQPIRT